MIMGSVIPDTMYTLTEHQRPKRAMYGLYSHVFHAGGNNLCQQ